MYGVSVIMGVGMGVWNVCRDGCKFFHNLCICLVALGTICGFKWVKK